MAEVITNRRWLGRLAFVVLVLALLCLQILPLTAVPPQWIGPDLILAVTLVWVVRRPELAPLPVVAALWFLMDLVMARPPGLMTALIVLLTEALRARNASLRALPFLLEWLTVSLGIIGLVLAYRLSLTLLMSPQPSLGLALMQMLMTMLAWPLVALAARFIFGITRPAPGEVDALGRLL